MTKAGEKLISAMNEAVKSAKCRHRWETVLPPIKVRRADGSVDCCAKCGTKRYTWTAKLAARR
jgi:hypothetical protein